MHHAKAQLALPCNFSFGEEPIGAIIVICSSAYLRRLKALYDKRAKGNCSKFVALLASAAMDQVNQDESAPNSGAKDVSVIRWGAGLLLVAALLVASVFVWRMLSDGSEPDLVTQAGEPNAETLLKLAEADPENSERWLEAGFAFFEKQNFSAAAEYYRKAAEIAPENAVAWSAFGEALAMQDERNPMPAEALDAFKKAVKLDPADPRSRYFLAIAQNLEGNKKAADGDKAAALLDHKAAIDDLLELLEDTPPGDPLEADLQNMITQIGVINEIPVDDRVKKALAGR